MKKVTKKERQAGEAFVSGVKAALKERGILVLEDPDDRNSAQCVAMTKFGRLFIHVHLDWIHTRFDLPALAKVVGCNPYSGKWNHHYSQTDMARDPAYLEDCVNDFARKLDSVEPGAWETSETEVTREEVAEHSLAYWERRGAFGEVVTVKDFDADAAREFLATKWTDNDGNTPEWMEHSNRTYLSRESDVRVFFHAASLAERNPEMCVPEFTLTEHTAGM